MQVESLTLVFDGIRYLNVDQIESIEVSEDKFERDGYKGDRVVTMASGRFYHSEGPIEELAEQIEMQRRHLDERANSILRHPTMAHARSTNAATDHMP